MRYSDIAKMQRHCERSEAIQGLMLNQQCYGLPRRFSPRNDGHGRWLMICRIPPRYIRG
jgi:hypothetical protein